MPPIPEGSEDFIKIIQSSKCVILAKEKDDEAKKITEIFKSVGEVPVFVEVNSKGSSVKALCTVYQVTGRFSLPLVFVKGDCVGNFADLSRFDKSGALKEALQDHEYDLIVIGGGSGGIPTGKEAAMKFGKKVAVLDFVKPTPLGTTWGLGGTCVNVGCIPKKLMHQAALLGKSLGDSRKFGWDFSEETVNHSWEKMKEAVQDHIGTLNWNYRVQLREQNITYLNAYGSFVGSHSIKAVNKRGKEQFLTADRFVIAAGLRPRYPDVPGVREHCITSDDLFSLSYNPGKTLLVGASYVSLECAGFLKGFGLDTTVMVRSILLRGFDQDMAERIGSHMESIGIKFIRKTVPTKFELIEHGKPGKIRVTAKTTDGAEIVDEYNTVVIAIGRDAVTDDMGLDVAGVERNEKNKKLKGLNEQSISAPHVYAIGDVLDGKPELTPVAIHAGRALSRRLFGESTEMTDYEHVPTTVFTPLEYGACGLAEEDAVAKYGEENVEVFHNNYQPLELTLPARDLDHCYAKLICNKADNMRVLGLHILGPNAGEITQGFGIAFKLNATKADFDNLIGIHPTCAEVFTSLTVTKSSAQVLSPSGC